MNEAEKKNNVSNCLHEFLDAINKYRHSISDLTHNVTSDLQHYHLHFYNRHKAKGL